MIKNYVRRHPEEIISYDLVFDDGHNNGFAFPCSENGTLLEMSQAAKDNYEFCMANPEKFVRFNKVIKTRHRYMADASGTCNCGETIPLMNEYMGACECPYCGQWWNIFGQELLPPDRWEEAIDF